MEATGVVISPYPLVRRWRNPDCPLPRRRIHGRHPLKVLPAHMTAPPWLATGPLDQPFDFCSHIGRLLMDIAARCKEYAHIQAPRILLSVLQARNGHRHGLQARVTPMRFAGGQMTRLRHGVPFHVQRYFLDDTEFLYLMTFCLPRFLNQSFDDKLVTVFHELHHIGPQFNGDLRRHHGRYQLHTHSRRRFDRHMAEHARAYLALQPDPEVLDFLRLDFAQLHQRHGAVVGIAVPRPKIVPFQGGDEPGDSWGCADQPRRS